MKCAFTSLVLCLALTTLAAAQPGPTPPAAPVPAPVQPNNDTRADPLVLTPPQDTMWVSTEYLLWWFKHEDVPPLIGSAPANSDLNGPVPSTDITTIFGDRPLTFKDFSGGRIMAGAWFDSDRRLELEGGGFFIAQRSLQFATPSTSDPVVGGVFTDASNGNLTIIVPGDPARASESASVLGTERLWGAESSLRYRMLYFSDSPVDVLAGLRYLDLATTLGIQTVRQFAGAGTRVRQNQFDAHDQFYGSQIGASCNIHGERWFMDVTGKLGLGSVHQVVDIGGNTQDIHADGTVQVFPGGYLALPSNIGHYSRSEFAVLPELTVNVGYQVASYLRVFVGYNVLQLSQATRAGDAIDGVANPAQIPGVNVDNPRPGNRPTFQFSQNDFWAMGVNFGFEFRY